MLRKDAQIVRNVFVREIVCVHDTVCSTSHELSGGGLCFLLIIFPEKKRKLFGKEVIQDSQCNAFAPVTFVGFRTKSGFLWEHFLYVYLATFV